MFWERFYKLCRQSRVTPNTVCKTMNLSNATATHWKNGCIPKGDVLCDIADYFHCSVDYLLGRTDSPAIEQSDVRTIENLTIIINGVKYQLVQADEKG